MATKKVPSIEDALNNFKDVMRRTSLTNFIYVNRIMLARNPKGQSILIVPELDLWNKIIDDTELKPNIRELDPNSYTDENLRPLFSYGEDLDNPGWIELDAQTIFNGGVIKVTLTNFDYTIPINKSLIPLRLKKAEANNMAYRIFINPSVIMCVKKKFDPIVPNSAFTIIRLWKVL